MQDSGLDVTDENRHRIGVAVGSGIGGIVTIETCHDVELLLREFELSGTGSLKERRVFHCGMRITSVLLKWRWFG